MIALVEYEAGLCPSCGTAEREWVDDDGRPLDDPPLEATARICHGCAATERKQEEVSGADVPRSLSRGGRVGLRRKAAG